MHESTDMRKCDDPAKASPETTTPPSFDEVVAKWRKRPWRYNRVWRKDQKWTREGLTPSEHQKAPIVSKEQSDQPTRVVPVPKQKLDDLSKELETTTSPPWPDEVVPKRRKRPWRYNKVWSKDRKWTREEQTQPQKVQPSAPVQKEQPTKVVPVRAPKQPEPPKFLRRYWRINRFWRKDMVWTKKRIDVKIHKTNLSPNCSSKIALCQHSRIKMMLASSFVEFWVKISKSITEPSKTKDVDDNDTSEACTQEVTALSSTDETRPNPIDDGQKAVVERIIDGLTEFEKLADDKVEGNIPGDSSGDSNGLQRVSDCSSTPLTDIQTEDKDKSTRKRKRPDCSFTPSKRLKSALFAPAEIEVQCLVRKFAAMSV